MINEMLPGKDLEQSWHKPSKACMSIGCCCLWECQLSRSTVYLVPPLGAGPQGAEMSGAKMKAFTAWWDKT